MPIYAVQMANRFLIREDGMTSVQRLTGRRWGRPVLLYGERVMFKPVKPKYGVRRGYDPPFEIGWYVGHLSRTSTMVLLTADGAKKGQTFRRVPEAERFVGDEFLALRGVPWNLVPVRVSENLPVMDPSSLPQVPIIAQATPSADGPR